MEDKDLELIKQEVAEIFKEQNIKVINAAYKAALNQILGMLKSGKTKKQIQDYCEFILKNSEKVQDFLLTNDSKDGKIK